MGTWGPGPFDNDAAADVLEALREGPSRFVATTLRRIARLSADAVLDVDDGGAAWAVCELVALAFGQEGREESRDDVLDLAAKVKPKEAQRLAALATLARLRDPATSEVAALWREGEGGARFAAALADLEARLTAAGAGPRAVTKAKPGDVIGLPAGSGATPLFAVQVLDPREVAVFEGLWPDSDTARAALKICPAHRVPAPVGKLFRRGERIAHLPVRQEFKGKKLYASETGALEHYVLSTASGGGMKMVSYEEARDHELGWPHGEAALLAIARGGREIARVRSPDEREAVLCARNASKWAARRESTTPGPFGDAEHLAKFVTSFEAQEDYLRQFLDAARAANLPGYEELLTTLPGGPNASGVESFVRRFSDEAAGLTGYGRPNEDAERDSYAFAGLVTLWRGTWSRDIWPIALARRLPDRPDDELMVKAVNAARILADQVMTRDAELRLIWDGAPDGGDALRGWVTALRAALT